MTDSSEKLIRMIGLKLENIFNLLSRQRYVGIKEINGGVIL